MFFAIILGYLKKGILMTYQSQTLTELKEDFMNAVDDYIDHGKEFQLNYMPEPRSWLKNGASRWTLSSEKA